MNTMPSLYQESKKDKNTKWVVKTENQCYGVGYGDTFGFFRRVGDGFDDPRPVYFNLYPNPKLVYFMWMKIGET